MAAYRDSGPPADRQLVDDLQTGWDAYADVAASRLIPAGNRNALIEWAGIRDREETARATGRLSGTAGTG
ncbi:hypothetical protein Acsp02_12470 [Actinoplanes sp. NBRC 103695]|nr:hypothetical protein Acsp02_12470 [Actinoplanes sp. NBRC 103695]